ncbi:hypothetical protein KKC1_13590 [Calderihabitans maritimus]|uniref:Uncharacterized protein n=1 Tax=Calderihabitans maritimus TaxID=1246530 RepID=A0A1Z5HS94_9FIRM|nr:hypothetical protein KKC1_13590 [Calderihabitans maritimus]
MAAEAVSKRPRRSEKWSFHSCCLERLFRKRIMLIRFTRSPKISKEMTCSQR